MAIGQGAIVSELAPPQSHPDRCGASPGRRHSKCHCTAARKRYVLEGDPNTLLKVPSVAAMRSSSTSGEANVTHEGASGGTTPAPPEQKVSPPKGQVPIKFIYGSTVGATTAFPYGVGPAIGGSQTHPPNWLMGAQRLARNWLSTNRCRSNAGPKLSKSRTAETSPPAARAQP